MTSAVVAITSSAAAGAADFNIECMLPPRLVPVGLPGATRGALPKAARPANALHHEAIRKLGEALEEGLEETDEPKATPALREPLRHRSRAAQRKKRCRGSEGLA